MVFIFHKSMRKEFDSMGEVEVPEFAYWGAQTERSRRNFKIGCHLMPKEIINSFAILKRCAAKTNYELGKIEEQIALAIMKACDKIIQEDLSEHFPLVVWQTGSGTQTNMNVNEVIANIACEILGYSKGDKTIIHPNDHVNYGQSSNDCFPTAMHIATAIALNNLLIPTLEKFSSIIEKKIKEFKGVIKIARTHLQDATPILLSQEFSAYLTQINNNIERLKATFPRLMQLAQGGTAVGTGINCPKGFAKKFAENVTNYTKLPFISSVNKFESLSCHDTLVEVSGVLNTIATSLMKIANDIRFLASGPRCGLKELHLPENEPGSSIMPGKVNPTQSEALTMVCCQVIGNHTAVTVAGFQGHFQLNVFKPVIIHNILESINLLNDSVESFITNCFKGISVNKEQLNENVEKCLMLATALNPIIGYDKAAQVVKLSQKENLSLMNAAEKLGFLTKEEFKKYIKPHEMV